MTKIVLVDVRQMICFWVMTHELRDGWLLDLLRYLRAEGVKIEDAIAAMDRFVDDAVALKERTSQSSPSRFDH